MEPVTANTVQAVWTVFKVVVGEIVTARAQALAASAAICTARMKTKRLRDLLLRI